MQYVMEGRIYINSGSIVRERLFLNVLGMLEERLTDFGQLRKRRVDYQWMALQVIINLYS